MTSKERIAKKQAELAAELAAEAAAHKQKIAAKQRALARLRTADRAEDRKARAKRKQVLAEALDQAGLLAWDDVTLLGVFEALKALLPLPDPVGLLEALLADTETALVATTGTEDNQPGGRRP